MDAKGIRPTLPCLQPALFAGAALACAAKRHAPNLSQLLKLRRTAPAVRRASVRAGKPFDQREEERAGWSGVGGPSVTLSGASSAFRALSFDGMSCNSTLAAPTFRSPASARLQPAGAELASIRQRLWQQDYSQMVVNFIWPLFTGGGRPLVGCRPAISRQPRPRPTWRPTSKTHPAGLTQTYFTTQLQGDAAAQGCRKRALTLEAGDQSVDVKHRRDIGSCGGL